MNTQESQRKAESKAASRSKPLKLLFAALLMFGMGGSVKERRPPIAGANNTPVLEIHLRDLGYQPAREYHYGGTGIPRDLSILNDDTKKRLTLLDEKTLVVYVSHNQLQTQKDGPPQSRNMEAFFVDTHSGALILHKTWPTIKRHWVNERWDTQARVLDVRGGFLVHAGLSLTLYSAGQKEKGAVPLEDGPSWAAVVAPMGRTIHLQRIDGDQAEGEWLASDTLKKLQSQREVPGITSSSDHAVVTKLAHCVQMQVVSEPPRNLCCSDPCRLGLPEFLGDDDILSVYPNGFRVLSADGENLWGREGPDTKTRVIGNHKRSLTGNRFAISLSGNGHTVFDHVKLEMGQLTILVYDNPARMQVFQLDVGSVTKQVDFDVSPDGSVLAVLLDDVVRLYKLPS